MLLVEPFFKTFLKEKDVSDSRKSTEVLVARSFDSRAEVDELMRKALAGGAAEFRELTDMEFMYQRSFEDLDGHVWELFWMDPGYVQ